MWYLRDVTQLELHGNLFQPANHHRVTRCSRVDRCIFLCLRMRRTEKELVNAEDIVDNLDASGISKDLFVRFVGDGCLLDKAKDKPDLVWSDQE